jgi:hypothetical protein
MTLDQTLDEAKQEEYLDGIVPPPQHQDESASHDVVMQIKPDVEEANQGDNKDGGVNQNDEKDEHDVDHNKVDSDKKTYMKVPADAPWKDRMLEVRRCAWSFGAFLSPPFDFLLSQTNQN